MTFVKRMHKLIIGMATGLTVAILGVVINSANAQAPTPSRQQLQVVTERCELLKTRLRGVENTDTAARIKRGRAYDQELIPYISAFNSRVAVNKVDAPELIRIAADLQGAVGQKFSSLYTLYADDLEKALQSDCTTNPAETYGWIQKARVDRLAVAQQVKNIDSLVEEYIKELAALKNDSTPAINKPEEGAP